MCCARKRRRASEHCYAPRGTVQRLVGGGPSVMSSVPLRTRSHSPASHQMTSTLRALIFGRNRAQLLRDGDVPMFDGEERPLIFQPANQAHLQNRINPGNLLGPFISRELHL